jgi:hypothetical protein
MVAVGRRMASQNVKYGRCTESKTADNASQAVQRVKLSKNSSFTGADNPENKTAEAWQFSRQTCWIAVLVDLTKGGSDDKLSTNQGDGAAILSEHSIVPKNEEHQKTNSELNSKPKAEIRN